MRYRNRPSVCAPGHDSLVNYRNTGKDVSTLKYILQEMLGGAGQHDGRDLGTGRAFEQRAHSGFVE